MENVEEVYRLSPTQEAMLFQSLLAPSSGAYVMQTGWTVRGGFDPDRFEAAFQRVIDANPALRTAFFWEGLAQPLQVVRKRLELPVERHDWRSLSAEEVERRVAAWLEEDRRRGFDPTQAPLMRLARFEIADPESAGDAGDAGGAGGDEALRYIWSHHHLLVDGWSIPLLLDQIFRAYRALADGDGEIRVETGRPYRDYIGWLESRDLAEAETFWREALEGVRGTAPAAGVTRGDDDVPGGEEAAGAAEDAGQDAGDDGYHTRRLDLSEAATERLRQLARTSKLTLSTLVSGAWALLLARHRGESDVTFGSVVSGRPVDLAGSERMVGLFINTVPVRVDADPDRPLGDWLTELQADQVKMRRFEHAPVARVREWAGLPRGRELFDNLLIFENLPGGEMVADWQQGFTVGEMFRTEDRTGYPLALAVFPEERLGLQLTAAADRWSGPATERLLGEMATLLEGMAEAGETVRRGGEPVPLGRLALLTEAETETLETWSGAGAASPLETLELEAGPLVHRWIAARAAATPDAPAVVLPSADDAWRNRDDWKAGEGLTYRQLVGRSRRLARRLLAEGLSPEARVAVALERGPDLLVAMLAVLEAGAAYVPLDPAYPAERLRFLLEDSGAAVLLVDEAHEGLAELAPEGVRVTPVRPQELEGAEGAEDPSEPIAPPPGPESAAYVIYTSGSTGEPKGVVVSHRALAHHTASAREAYRVGPEDRVLQFASVSFDASAEEIYPCLASGATLVLRTAAMAESVDRFLEAASAWGLTVLDLPTAWWHQVTGRLDEVAGEGGGGSDRGLAVPASVRLVVIGGEAARADRLASWQRHLSNPALPANPSAELVNTYGPTEATIVATRWWAPAPGAALPAGAPPIGRPLAGTRARVVDRSLRPAPLGAAGELVLGGPGLARGYLGRPAATAERFVPDPFSGEPGARLYRTGDLVAWGEDGQLRFRGRADHQVKVRGFRIEPGEVEARLAAHPAIAEVAVVARPDATGQTVLVAHPVLREGEAPEAAELRAFVADALPGHMVPSRILPVAALPVGPTGKVDRQAVAGWDLTGDLTADGALAEPSAQGDGAPSTPTEEELAAIWASVLGVETVSVRANLFDLGAHSLMITQVIARCRDAFEVEVPLETFFESPTVASQARRVETLVARRASGAGTLELPPVTPLPRDGRDFPLSYPQERLWFLAQLEPDSSSYHVPRALRLSGDLDGEALRRAYENLVERHEIFRTTFPVVGGKPVQRVHPLAPFPLPVIDLTALAGRPGLPAGLQDRELARLVLADGQRLFDFEHGPLLRASLVRLDGGDREKGARKSRAAKSWAVIQTEHHLVHDGWAEGVLLGDLLALYDAHASRKPSPLPPLPVQFADFAAWQRRVLTPELLEQQRAYWKRHLTGAPAFLELPADRPRPPVLTGRGDAGNFYVPRAMVERLKALGQSRGATLFMTMLAAFEVVVARWSGEDDLVIGSGVANRRRQELEGMIGMVINTLALRTDLSGDPTFEELLARVRRTCLGAYAHQDFPFQLLVEAVQPPRSPSHTPIFQVAFAFYDSPAPIPVAEGLTLDTVNAQNRSSKFDLLWIVTPDIPIADPDDPKGDLGAVRVHMEWSSDLFDRATIERFWSAYESVLEAALEAPESRLSELPLLPEPEAAAVRRAWAEESRAAAEIAPAPAVAGRILARAEATPDAVALEGWGGAGAGSGAGPAETLTYAQLAERSAQLARRMARLVTGSASEAGTRAEPRVALLLPRTPDLAVAMVAALRAGVQWLPLDAADPGERLARVLGEARPDLILTTGDIAGHLAAGPVGELLGELSAAGRVIEVDRPGSEPATGGAAPPALDRALPPSRAAYTLYTSGTTGRPKGAVLTRGGLDGLVEAQVELFRLEPGRRVLQFASPGFDAAVSEILTALAAGATLVFDDREALAPGPALAGALERHRIDTVTLTPTVLAAVAAALEPAEPPGLPGLTTVISAGEALPRALADRWLAPGRTLINAYGPTETTVCATGGQVTAGDRRPALGEPLPGLFVRVVDPAGGPVQTGVPGELLVGGRGLARGYLGRPALTAERFVPDPTDDGTRLYRTGDLGRWRDDGGLEVFGRVDHQVKVRGVRVELEEVEAALADHPEVREAAVAPWSTSSGDLRLVAWLVAEEAGDPPDGPELLAHLRRRLPSAMVPAAFAPVEALPRTPSGKLDRRGLRDLADPVVAALGGSGEPVAPRTETEEAVAALWREVLELETVGVHTRFFDLGGHSLLATQLVSRLNEELEPAAPVSLREFFAAPTVAALAAHLDGATGEGPAGGTSPAEADAIGRVERGGGDLSDLLAGLDELSDEEAGALLAGSTAGAGAAGSGRSGDDG